MILLCFGLPRRRAPVHRSVRARMFDHVPRKAIPDWKLAFEWPPRRLLEDPAALLARPSSPIEICSLGAPSGPQMRVLVSAEDFPRKKINFQSKKCAIQLPIKNLMICLSFWRPRDVKERPKVMGCVRILVVD